MANVIYNFRALEPTGAITNHAELALLEVADLLPDSTEYRWLFGFQKHHKISYAQMEVKSPSGFRIIVRESGHDLYKAITDVTKKLGYLVSKQHERRIAESHAS
jgi:ribosome-associated translation inhibitor RaiA